MRKITPYGACDENSIIIKYKKSIREENRFMHMADALLVPVIGVGMYAASAVPTAISIKKVDLKKET